MIARFALVLALGCMLCVEAGAQSDDAAYCDQLTALYRRYLGKTSEGRPFPDVTVSVAMDACARGNTAAGIPVLEKRLRDARIALPGRA